jgi:hypothetical protein
MALETKYIYIHNDNEIIFIKKNNQLFTSFEGISKLLFNYTVISLINDINLILKKPDSYKIKSLDSLFITELYNVLIIYEISNNISSKFTLWLLKNLNEKPNIESLKNTTTNIKLTLNDLIQIDIFCGMKSACSIKNTNLKVIFYNTIEYDNDEIINVSNLSLLINSDNKNKLNGFKAIELAKKYGINKHIFY